MTGALTGREIVALKKQCQKTLAAAQAVVAKTISENREVTPSEQAQFMSLHSEADALSRIIERAEAEAERRAKDDTE